MSFEQRLLSSTVFGASYTNWPANTPIGAQLPDDTVFLPTGAANQTIYPGDLVVAAESGVVLPIDPTLGVSIGNNNSAGPAAIQAPVALSVGANFGLAATEPHIAMLKTGNIAKVYSGDGSSSTTRVNLRIESPLGGAVIAPITVSSDSGISSVRVYEAPISGRILVSWLTGTTLKFAVYNADFSLFTAATTVASLTGGSWLRYSVSILANDNISFFYAKATSLNAAAAYYTQAGAVAVAEFTIEASSDPTALTSNACANGDVVFCYFRSAATAAQKIVRYNNSGTIQGTLTTYGGTNQISFGAVLQGLRELPNGNIIALTPRTLDSRPAIYLFNSSLTLQKTIDLGGNTVAGFCPGLCLTPNGGFAIGYFSSSTSVVIRSLDSAGNELLGETSLYTLAGGGTGSPANVILIFPHGSAGFGLFINSFDGTQYQVTELSVTPTGALRGSAVVLEAASATVNNFGWAVISPLGAVYAQYARAAATGLRTAIYATLRTAIQGVAQTVGSLYAAAQISRKGSFKINQNVTNGGAFDCRSNAVGGSRGTVFGQSVFLNGSI